jgi:hypothetical protein
MCVASFSGLEPIHLLFEVVLRIMMHQRFDRVGFVNTFALWARHSCVDTCIVLSVPDTYGACSK